MSTDLQQGSPRHPGDNMPPPSMNHPSSPMRPPMQDGYHPASPPDLRGHHDPSTGMGGYRGPPPSGYGGAPPGYPPYPSYGPPPQNGYGSPPPSHGYPPPGGYPPHHHPSYGYGYPPGPRPPYGYGYEGGYPGQQSQNSPPFRGGAHPHQGPPPPQQHHSQRSPQKGSPPSTMPVGSSGNASPTLSPSSQPHRPKTVEHVEVERLRFAAAAEITHEDVKPIRSDFHFFVMENKEKCRKLSEEEVRKSAKAEGELDHFLVNSNLNTRMMKLWEDLKSEERGSYMVKEEDDRRRFMEEDEIASRHCATLTARGKSPRASEKHGDKDKVKKEERQESETKPAATPPREAPTRKMEESNEDSIDDSNEDSVDVKKEGEGIPAGSPASRSEHTATIEVDSIKKRLSPPSSSPVSAVEEDTSESPTKRKRLESAY